MNRRLASLLVLVLASVPLCAQETKPAPEPDFSRDRLMQILAAGTPLPEPEPAVRYRVGAVEFRALGTGWRFNYLPIMAPLYGGRPTTSREWPDAFSLLSTPIATGPRKWRAQRQYSSELRRINDLDKKARVVVKK